MSDQPVDYVQPKTTSERESMLRDIQERVDKCVVLAGDPYAHVFAFMKADIRTLLYIAQVPAQDAVSEAPTEGPQVA